MVHPRRRPPVQLRAATATVLWRSSPTRVDNAVQSYLTTLNSVRSGVPSAKVRSVSSGRAASPVTPIQWRRRRSRDHRRVRRGARRGGRDCPRVRHPAVDSRTREMLEHESARRRRCAPTWRTATRPSRRSGANLHVLCEAWPNLCGPRRWPQRRVAATRPCKWACTGGLRAGPPLQPLSMPSEMGDICTGATCMRQTRHPGWGVFTQKALRPGGALIDIGVHTLKPHRG